MAPTPQQAPPTVERAPQARSVWKAVALPAEHGGWGLTLEPAVLGLAVAPSIAGVLLSVAGVLAFLVRTPLKLALVDRRRGRRLARTDVARRVAGAELVLLVGLAAGALRLAGWTWLVPVGLAVPLVGVELWFDARSRGRRLVPELCGAVGMAALASAVVIAGGGGSTLAYAVWGVLAGRSLAAIPSVRVQILRLHRGEARRSQSDLAQVAGTLLAATTLVVEPAAAAGVVAVAATAGLRLVLVRRPPIPAVRLGAAEAVLGVLVVVVTAVGLALGGAT
jgi:hypothetical protein